MPCAAGVRAGPPPPVRAWRRHPGRGGSAGRPPRRPRARAALLSCHALALLCRLPGPVLSLRARRWAIPAGRGRPVRGRSLLPGARTGDGEESRRSVELRRCSRLHRGPPALPVLARGERPLPWRHGGGRAGQDAGRSHYVLHADDHCHAYSHGRCGAGGSAVRRAPRSRRTARGTEAGSARGSSAAAAACVAGPCSDRTGIRSRSAARRRGRRRSHPRPVRRPGHALRSRPPRLPPCAPATDNRRRRGGPLRRPRPRRPASAVTCGMMH